MPAICLVGRGHYPATRSGLLLRLCRMGSGRPGALRRFSVSSGVAIGARPTPISRFPTISLPDLVCLSANSAEPHRSAGGIDVTLSAQEGMAAHIPRPSRPPNIGMAAFPMGFGMARSLRLNSPKGLYPPERCGPFQTVSPTRDARTSYKPCSPCGIRGRIKKPTCGRACYEYTAARNVFFASADIAASSFHIFRRRSIDRCERYS